MRHTCQRTRSSLCCLDDGSGRGTNGHSCRARRIHRGSGIAQSCIPRGQRRQASSAYCIAAVRDVLCLDEQVHRTIATNSNNTGISTSVSRAAAIGGIACITTWPALSYRLHQIAESSLEFLPHKLHPQPEKGGFVKANRLIELLGPKYGGFQDFVNISPREQDLDSVINHLKPLLLESETILDTVPRRSRTHSLHFRATTITVPMLDLPGKLWRKALVSCFGSQDTIATRKSCDHEALEKEDPQWLNSTINFGSEIDLMPESPRALCLAHVTNGRRIVITTSYFTALVEDTSEEQLFNSIKAVSKPTVYVKICYLLVATLRSKL